MIPISMRRSIGAAILTAGAALLLTPPSFAMTFGMVPRAVAHTAAEVTVSAPTKLPLRKLPRGARYLGGQELFELYVGKTWKWGEGGGYFGPQGIFRARTYGDSGETNAGGSWAVNEKGRMCFRAVWSSSAGNSKANTCFDHMVLGGDIYQRRMPNGDWYIFRHANPEPGDEYDKLVDGNILIAKRTDAGS